MSDNQDTACEESPSLTIAVQEIDQRATGRQKPIWRVMAVFLIPLMLSNALQSVGQLLGTIVVGRWLGVNALAAISAFFPLFFLLVSFTIGVGTGSSILIGQAYGAGNHDRLKAVVGTTLTFTLLLGIVLAVLGGVFIDEQNNLAP